MQLAGFLKDNITWLKNRDCFRNLLDNPTTEEGLFARIDDIQSRPLLTRRQEIRLNTTEFCLNDIALCKSRWGLLNIATGMFDNYWKSFLRLKDRLKGVAFPACGETPRIVEVAEAVVKGTQCVYTSMQYQRIRKHAMDVLTDDIEKYHYDDVVALCVIRYYCMAWQLVRKKHPSAEWCLSRLLPDNCNILRSQYKVNNRYCFTNYNNGIVTCGVDCLANSNFHDSGAGWDCNVRVLSNGRNVFDTFCNHRFGRHIAEFSSVSKALTVKSRLFVQDNSRVCNYTVVNNGKKKRVFTVRFSCNADVSNAQYFFHRNAKCVGYYYQGRGHYFGCVVVGGDVRWQDDSMCGTLKIEAPAESTHQFSIVSVCDDDVARLTATLDHAHCYGYTRCGKVMDNDYGATQGLPMVLSSANNLVEVEQSKDDFTFSHRFGNCDISTLATDNGNECTLINGFFAGMSSVAVYSVGNNKVEKLNTGAFEVVNNGMQYKRSDSMLQFTHTDNRKVYSVSFTRPKRVLVRFNFEGSASVQRQGTVFKIRQGDRSYDVNFCGAVESFTTNPLECNSNRLRYKLSGDDKTARCLAVCLKADVRHEFAFVNHNVVMQGQPIVQESLLSAYLNYINEKNQYLVANKLTRWDSLTLSAMCYTNSPFVGQIIRRLADSSYIQDGKTQFYDKQGNLAMCCDSLALTLASVYYATLTNDLSVLEGSIGDYIKRTLFKTNYQGQQLCIVALALKKLARLQVNRTETLIRYADMRKQICADKQLYPYAQAIGAVPMYNPSKQRLKDLVNKYGIPRCWYYVSQLENLYGVDVCCNKVNVRPLVDGQSYLEQFAIVYHGKRLDTVFKQSATKGMSVNGISCYQPLSFNGLKEDNKLEVRY